MKLKFKLLIVILIISLLPLISFSEILSAKSIGELRRKTEAGIFTLTQLKSEKYDDVFKRMEMEIDVASKEIGEIWGKYRDEINYTYTWIAPGGNTEDARNYKSVYPVIKGICMRNKEISLVYFGSESGVLFLSDERVVRKLENTTNFDFKRREWYVKAEEKGGNVWTEYIDFNTGDVTLSNSQPVYNEEGNFIGVVSLDLPLTILRNDILDIKFEGEGYAIIVDKNGNIVVHPDYTAHGKKWNESFEEMNILNISGLSSLYEDIKNGREGIKRLQMDGTYYAAYSCLKEINGSLVFLLPSYVVSEPIEKMRKILWMAAIFLSALIIVTSIALALDITKPVERLKKAATEIARGNLEYTVGVSSNDEIGDLADNFNQMTKKLKELTKNIEESEKKYRGIFENSVDAVYISNDRGNMLDVNKAGEELFGYTREELLSMNVENLYADKKDRERFKKEIRKKGYVKNFEVKLKKKNGMEIDCLLSTIMLKQGDEIIYQGIIKDITPIKEARKEIEMYNSLLRHDIGNRLQIAIGIMELIKDEEKDEEIKKLMEKAFDNLLSIRDMLLKLRMINKASEIKLKKTDAGKAIEEAIGHFADMAREKGIKIHYNGVKGYVFADEMLVNIFMNIIENAVKHSKCRNIYINGMKEKDYFIVEIKNDGIPIPSEISKKLFEMGVKGEDSKGLGLGLHLVKRIIEKYGGKIEMESNEKETTFRIFLKNYE